MLKSLLSLIALRRDDSARSDDDGNQTRELPQRWRDPPPRPARAAPARAD